eukprot:7501211-Ditylum_brightwellii.AAC.1
MHNKRLGKEAMHRAEIIRGIAMEQYGTTTTFIDLVSNYDLVVHSIAALALQHIAMPKEPISSTFTTLHNMVHTCQTVFGDSIKSYGGDIWAISCKPPPQGLGQ